MQANVDKLHYTTNFRIVELVIDGKIHPHFRQVNTARAWLAGNPLFHHVYHWPNTTQVFRVFRTLHHAMQVHTFKKQNNC